MPVRSLLFAWSLIVLLAVMPSEAISQSTKRVARVALIHNVLPSDQMESNPVGVAFRGELVRLGWIPGRNVEILWRSLEGDVSRTSEVLDDLLRHHVDVIVLGSNRIAGEAQMKSRTVAIVTLAANDPVGTGLASDLGRPGANITGVIYTSDFAIYGKRLSLFRDVLPTLSRVAYFTWRPVRSSPEQDETDAAFEGTARGLAISLITYRIRRIEEMEAAFADAKRKHADGAFVDYSSIFYDRGSEAFIQAQAERLRIPVMYSALSGAEAGGLIAYGVHPNERYKKAAQFVDRILKGAKPGDIPFEQVGNFSLYVNKKAAKAIGLTIPGSILIQADKVIE
jgi:putative ABC transport system substrate-binding protein